MDRSTVAMRGVSGRVQWGYQVAAILPTWELTGNADGGTVTGPAVSLDTFRVSQRPLVFVVPRAKGSWRWPLIEGTLQITGDTLTASVGPCME